MNKRSTYTATASAQSFTKWSDYKLLIKVNLSTVVVITSVLAYIIAAGEQFSMFALSLLAVGGFLVTAAANAINQVLEKDFDKLMERTADRPVTAGRMKSSEAVMFAGVSCLIGISMLSMFNPITALLGMLSFVTYSFVYTPLKRFSTVAVAVGAIPGALPVLIGCTAFEGTISAFAVSLFVIQFLWQFPHFWAIGYLGFEDYNKAGYKLLPEENGSIHRDLGKYSTIYSLLIIPVLGVMYYSGLASVPASLIASAATLVYVYYSVNFHIEFNRSSARALMFCSFFLYASCITSIHDFFNTTIMESLRIEQNHNTRINPQKFALWIGMASIIMMFGAFTSAYIVKHAAGNWLEFPIPKTFYISTIVIVLSSITLHSSYIAYKKQKHGLYKSMLVLSLLLGIAFIACQYNGWRQLFDLGVDMKANVSGSFFYLITGAHALHVLGGITAIIIATIHAFTLKFRYTEKRKNRFELVIHYWHFVGILWIYLLYFLLNN